MSSDNDDSSEPIDYATPLSSLQSSPPSLTSTIHDTRRAKYHMKDLASFAATVEAAANRAFPNSGRPISRYKSVQVLLLRWDEDDLDVAWEVEDLEKVFKSYGFDTEIWLIPSDNSHLELMIKAASFVKAYESMDTLFVVYYGGHATINAARQSTWSCKRNISYASLEWSATQTLFEKAKSDVLLLLDCCSAASAAPMAGRAIIETIAACGWESIAAEPGRFSFTDTLIKVLEEWINRPFTAAMLHSEILSRLKHERPERMGSQPIERRRTPVYIVTTADVKACSIQLSKLSPPPIAELEAATAPEIRPVDAESHHPINDHDDNLNDSKHDGTLRFPHVLISVALEENQILDGEACGQWISEFPALAKFAKVESVFRSYSTLLLVSIPVVVWNLLPKKLAYSFVGYVSSNNLLKNSRYSEINTVDGTEDGGDTAVKIEQLERYLPKNYKWHHNEDENAPERPPSAYNIFSNELRERFKGRGLSFIEIAKIINESWQSLSLEEKKPYEQQALVFKEYSEKLADYKAKRTSQYQEYAQHIVDFKPRQMRRSQDDLPRAESPPTEYSPHADHKRKRSEEQTSFSRSNPVGERAYETGEKSSKRPIFSLDTTHMAPYQTLSPQRFKDSSPEASIVGHFDWGSPATLPLLRIPGSDQVPGLSYTRDSSPWGSSLSDSTFSTFSATSDASHHPRSWSLRSRSTPTSVPVACDRCRKRKLRCSGDSRNGGICINCKSAGNDSCQFSRISLPDVYFRSDAIQYDSIPEQYDMPSFRPLLEVPTSFSANHEFIEPSKTPISIWPEMKGSFDIDKFGGLTISSSPSHQPSFEQLDAYVLIYWKSFDPLYPIIHRGTFSSSQNPLLVYAMAAIGTQYHSDPNVRKEGVGLNDHCKKVIDLTSNWTLETMQAIFLIEIFTRFRGRKITMRCSRQFKELCTRLSQGSLDASHQATISPPSEHCESSSHDEWKIWLLAEQSRRLQAACFILDVRQSIYYEQSRINRPLTGSIYLPCDEIVWVTSSAETWLSLKPSMPPRPVQVSKEWLSEYFPQDNHPTSPGFFQSILISSLATHLPEREDPTYPNEYELRGQPYAMKYMVAFCNKFAFTHILLAFYNTPLHDLLSVAGDSWVFGEKITPPSAFHSAQARLKIWSSSTAAAAAAHHACYVLKSVVSEDQAGIERLSCISDWWTVYISVLICWVFGHRCKPFKDLAISSTCPSSPNTTMDIGFEIDEQKVMQQEALSYIDSMIAVNTEDLLTSKAAVQGDTTRVITMVRVILEKESAGCKSELLLDAVSSLKRIEQGGRAGGFE